eukprot:CAMPEP_0174739266 /NCGR_PEP_ID=MMETSP1094-20130205/71307_1 /TAXON_ID=156173 /ORGANISM="Chrysochromulina brevifilum, Strain UTEX LB 985" /LENGTH=64 /DNA_ID=CAMNT_0015942809 /DNA_START=523 /DNA_END=717 /DNA_ORIENTATION=+
MLAAGSHVGLGHCAHRTWYSNDGPSPRCPKIDSTSYRTSIRIDSALSAPVPSGINETTTPSPDS